MTDVTKITPAETAIQAAHREIAEENQKKAVKVLKSKLRELEEAKTIVANVEREIVDLEQRIKDGNL